MAQDYYSLLGVPRSATEDEIRTAYRKLAHQYHPDKTGGDKAAEDKLKGINEAYDVLKNKEKRQRYDQFGEAGAGAGFGGGGGGFQGFGGGGGAGSPFDDIFDAFFGGGGGRRGGARPTQGDDLEYRLTITLRDAAFGVKKTLEFPRQENCNTCSGSGAAPGSSRDTCKQCGGAGQVRMSQGFFSVSRTCPVCHGSGSIIANPCRDCRGSGRVETQRELNLDIPAGVDNGSRLRVPGEGEPGAHGGPRGDLYVRIMVEADDIFSRDGNDILCRFPVSFPQAILGITAKVPTLEGEAELKIPAGTQSGTVFRLRGMGVPDLRGYRNGDQLVEVQVETPTKLTKEQKELIHKFEELSTHKTYPLHKKFFDKIKASLGG